MNVWFTSDLHFGHKNIIEYCERPYDYVADMDESLIRNWNSVVEEGDEVWVLGDVSFYRWQTTLEIVRRLRGRKHLVVGNHDRLHPELVEQYRTVTPYSAVKFKDSAFNTRHVVMCHYALRVWDRSHYGSYNLHGHSHNTLPPLGKQLDVGVDSAKQLLGEYRPFSLDEVVEIMNTREYKQADHHHPENKG